MSHELRAAYCLYCRANYVVMVTDITINFRNTRDTRLFYNFLKHILHGLENISIFNT